MYYLFYNPCSNAGKTEKDILKFEKKLNKKGFNTIKINLMDDIDLKEIISEIDKNDIVVIAGGDGTINWMLNTNLLNDIESKIYVYRSGRGNDFSRNFKSRFFEIKEGFHGFPTISYSGLTQSFVNGMGMGIDSVTCNIQHENFKIGKKISYFKVACEAFKSFKTYSLDVKVDGKDYHFDNCWFFVIQNGKYFGGGMKISPESIINDGNLELCIVHDMNLSKLLTVFPLIFIGKQTIFKKELTYLRGKEFEASPIGTDVLQIDGEIRKNIHHVVVKS